MRVIQRHPESWRLLKFGMFFLEGERVNGIFSKGAGCATFRAPCLVMEGVFLKQTFASRRKISVHLSIPVIHSKFSWVR